MIEDMSDAVALLTSGTYTVTHRTASAYTDGRRTAPTTSTESITASVQPASGRDIQRLPEGKRDRETIVIFTATQLKVGLAGAQEADLISVNGSSFEVTTVEPWAALGNFYRCVAVLS
jgi:hypothetical protein